MVSTVIRSTRVMTLLSSLVLLCLLPVCAASNDQQLVEQARACIEKRQLTKALYYLDCAEKLNPNNRLIFYNRGRIFNKEEKYELAAEQYTRAIAIEPKYASALTRRAAVYIELKQYKRALDDLHRSLTIRPNDADAYSIQTRAYCDLGENSLALKSANKLIALSPERSNYVVRARIKMNLHDYKSAIEDLTCASVGNRRDDEAYLLRAQSHEALRNYKEAIADYTRIIEFNKNDEVAHQMRGDVYLKTGALEKSIADYSRAIELSPEPGAAL